MTRIHRMEIRWDEMSQSEKVQEVATKTRLLAAAEAGDIETIGSIDIATYFGPATIFTELVGKIVEANERYKSLLRSPMVRSAMLSAAKNDRDNAVALFKSMFKHHYELLASQTAEIQRF